jgi:hypothetical protein
MRRTRNVLKCCAGFLSFPHADTSGTDPDTDAAAYAYADSYADPTSYADTHGYDSPGCV